jgi:hypothetical protein
MSDQADRPRSSRPSGRNPIRYLRERKFCHYLSVGSHSSSGRRTRRIFRRKTDEERQAEAARKQEQEYQASPVGQAAAAFARGNAFFQIRIPVTSMSRWAPFYEERERRLHVPIDVLGQIEAVGWRLEHASWVFAVQDEDIDGIFLFRRNDRRSRGHANESPVRAANHVATHPTAPMARLAGRWPLDTALSHRPNGFSLG